MTDETQTLLSRKATAMGHLRRARRQAKAGSLSAKIEARSWEHHLEALDKMQTEPTTDAADAEPTVVDEWEYDDVREA